MLFIARTSLTHYCQDMPDRCKVGDRRRWSCGNVEIAERFARVVGTVQNLGSVLQGFHPPGISTAHAW